MREVLFNPTVFILGAMVYASVAVFTTAFESGSYGSLYWLPRVRDKKEGWTRPDDKGYPWYSYGTYWLHPGETYFYELDDEASGHMTLHRVTWETIEAGIKTLADKYPDGVKYLIGDEDSDDIADGPEADVIVQYLILGEERYG